MSHSRSFLVAWMLWAVGSACTDGGPTDSAGRAVTLDLAPSFQVDPSLFVSDPIDRIRLGAFDAATLQTVGASEVTVDPSRAEWVLSLGVELGDATSLDVVVEVELLSGQVVQWSGRVGPITVRSDGTLRGQSIAVHRGPLANMDVETLVIGEAPAQLSVGGIALVAANLTLVAGSDATPTIYWASTDPTVATVTSEGPLATLTGVSPGTVEIVAAAGAAYDEFSLEVRAATPSGSKVWVGGAASGPTDWHNGDNWNPAGVPGPTDDVSIPAEGSADLSADAAVGSLVMEGFATLDLAGFTLTVSGNLDAESALISNGLVRVTGPGSSLRGYFDALELSATRTVSGLMSISGDVSLVGADLNVNGQSVFVGGSLLVSGLGARLVMTTPGGGMYVSQSAVFDGGDHAGLLTDGQLVVVGDFTVTSRSSGGFAATGNHVLYLGGGATPQTVSFALPGASQQRVANLIISTLQTTFGTDATVTGYAWLTAGTMTVPDGVTITIDGTLTLYGGQFNVDGAVNTSGECFNYGAIVTGTGIHECGEPLAADRAWLGGDAVGPSDWSNANNWLPAGVPAGTESVAIPNSSNPPVLSSDAAIASLVVGFGGTLDQNGFTLTVTGDLSVDGAISNGLTDLVGPGAELRGFVDRLRVTKARALSGFLHTQGDLDIHAPLTIGAQTLQVFGSLSVSTATGTLVMADPSASVFVNGKATFDGASHNGYLTSGSILLYGDFTAGSTFSPESFHATGTAVYLGGSGDQTLFLTTPGLGGQVFSDLYVAARSVGAVGLASSAYVTGLFYANTSTLRRIGVDATLEVRGGLQVYQTTFDALPVRLVSTVAPNSPQVFDVTFTNMPTDVAQLYLELEGAGASVPFVIDTPTFLTEPALGEGYYLHIVNTTQEGLELVVNVLDPTPASRDGYTLTAGGPVTINWPFP